MTLKTVKRDNAFQMQRRRRRSEDNFLAELFENGGLLADYDGTHAYLDQVVKATQDGDPIYLTAGSALHPNKTLEHALSLQTELVVNGNFANDNDWNKGSGWTIANGVATNSGTTTTIDGQAALPDLILDASYIAKYSVVLRTSGAVTINNSTSFMGPTHGDFDHNAIGTYQTIGQCVSLSGDMRLVSRSLIGDVDDLSVKQIPDHVFLQTDPAQQTILRIGDGDGPINKLKETSDNLLTVWESSSNGTTVAFEDGYRITNTGAHSFRYRDGSTYAPVIPGEDYNFNFQAKNNGGDRAKYRIYDQSNLAWITAAVSYFDDLTTEYSLIDGGFTAPAGCTKVSVYVINEAAGGADIIFKEPQVNESLIPRPFQDNKSHLGGIGSGNVKVDQHWQELDGVSQNNGAKLTGASWQSNCDVIVACRNIDNVSIIFGDQPTGRGLFLMGSGQTGNIYLGVGGSPTTRIDNVLFTGNRGNLYDIGSDSDWHIFHAIGADLSGWPDLNLSGYSGWLLGAEVNYPYMLLPFGQVTDENRTKIYNKILHGTGVIF